jgi:hypothetical protein
VTVARGLVLDSVRGEMRGEDVHQPGPVNQQACGLHRSGSRECSTRTDVPLLGRMSGTVGDGVPLKVHVLCGRDTRDRRVDEPASRYNRVANML